MRAFYGRVDVSIMVKKYPLKAAIVQLVRYSISGGAYFWTGYLVFFLCDKGLGFSLWWSKLLANIAGVTVNFLLTRYWAFNRSGQKQAYQAAPGRYVLLTLVNFVVDYWLILWLKSVGITPYLGQFISAGFFWGWNFLWYRLWVFRPKNRIPIRKISAAMRKIKSPKQRN